MTPVAQMHRVPWVPWVRVLKVPKGALAAEMRKGEILPRSVLETAAILASRKCYSHEKRPQFRMSDDGTALAL
jgi:hypothetical protein